MEKNSDPTKDPKFEKVVRHFLSTPPTPHNSPSKAKPKGASDASPKKRGRPLKKPE